MLHIRNLCKNFGALKATDDVSLSVDRGTIHALIGPNGAGKTTTMRIIATLLEPTQGEAYVCGHSIYNDAKEIRGLVGYMPDFFGVYDDMKVIEVSFPPRSVHVASRYALGSYSVRPRATKNK